MEERRRGLYDHGAELPLYVMILHSPHVPEQTAQLPALLRISAKDTPAVFLLQQPIMCMHADFSMGVYICTYLCLCVMPSSGWPMQDN